MSEVEVFYAAVQVKLGGNRPYHSLHPLEQHELIRAINVIISLTQGHGNEENPTQD